MRVSPEANSRVLTIDIGYDIFEALPWSYTPLELSEIFPMGVLYYESRCISLILAGLCFYLAWQAQGKKSYLCSYCSYYCSLLSRLLLASLAAYRKNPYTQRFSPPFWLKSSYIACLGSSPTTSRSYGSPLGRCYSHLFIEYY